MASARSPSGSSRLSPLATAIIAALLIAPFLPLATGTAAAQDSQLAKLAKGKFLVATEELRDPNFSRTVVLLLEYGPEGALGLVVNRPTTTKLADLLTEVEGLEKRQDTVYVGGPVLPGHMLVLVRSADAPESAQRVVDEVYYSGDRELLAQLAEREGDDVTFRVFSGHSGWAPGQLEWEMRRGSWHVATADAEAVFEVDPGELWEQLNRRSSGVWAWRGDAEDRRRISSAR